MDEKGCSNLVIGATIQVHRILGPGLLESAYEAALAHELELGGLSVQRQPLLPVVYKGLELPSAYRLDLVVEDLVIIEIKSVDKVLPVHQAQLLRYLKLSNKRLGLLFNFNEVVMRRGIKRIVS